MSASFRKIYPSTRERSFFVLEISFLQNKNEASFLFRMAFQKRVFAVGDSFLPVWWEKVSTKTKTRFCFSFSLDLLDRPKEPRNFRLFLLRDVTNIQKSLKGFKKSKDLFSSAT